MVSDSKEYERVDGIPEVSCNPDGNTPLSKKGCAAIDSNGMRGMVFSSKALKNYCSWLYSKLYEASLRSPWDCIKTLLKMFEYKAYVALFRRILPCLACAHDVFQQLARSFFFE